MELEIFQARCDQELKAAIDRGDNASAQSWAKLKAAVIAEKQRRLQILAPPTPSPIPGKTITKRHRYRPARQSTPRPMQESTPRATPEEFPLPPGWPVGPKGVNRMRVSIWPEYLGIHSMRQWQTCFYRSLLSKAFNSSTELLGAFKCSSSFYSRTTSFASLSVRSPKNTG